MVEMQQPEITDEGELSKLNFSKRLALQLKLNNYTSEAEALDAKYHQLVDEVRTEKNAIIDDVNSPVGE